MGKKLNAEELKEHIKKNGITLVRMTGGYENIPSRVKLWFGLNSEDDLSSYNNATDSKNKEFNYDFDYGWCCFYEYIGLFELVEEEPNIAEQIIEHLENGKIETFDYPAEKKGFEISAKKEEQLDEIDKLVKECNDFNNLIIHCPTKEDYIKIVDKIGWRKDKEGSANWETYGIDTTLTIKNNKITGYADLEFDKNHKP
jgi:hypothetical protein